MGLPVWRDPSEPRPSRLRNKPDDPTAAARSTIRRRPEYPARASSRHPPPPYPSRLERATTLRDPRRYASRLHNAANSAIPPVRSLLETVDRLTPTRSATTAPPPVPALPSERFDSFRSAYPSDITASDFDWELELFPTPEEDDSDTVDLNSRPHSRDGHVPRTRLPGAAELAGGAEVWATGADISSNVTRSAHPLRHSWRPSSPSIQGLGDRTRSPTPDGAWELMRTTIAPDEVLPSAESSFASAAASRSFGSSSLSRAAASLSSRTSFNSRTGRGEDTSEEFAALADDICAAESTTTDAIGEAMFLCASLTTEGYNRLVELQRDLFRSGHYLDPPGLGLRLLEGLSEEAIELYLSPTSGIPTNLRRFLRARRFYRSVQSPRRSANEETSNPRSRAVDPSTGNPNRNEGIPSSTPAPADASQSRPSQRDRTTTRSIPTTTSSTETPPTDPSATDLGFPTEVVTDIRALNTIFLRLAARGDVCDEIWETVGLLMSTTAGHLASPPQPPQQNPSSSSSSSSSSLRRGGPGVTLPRSGGMTSATAATAPTGPSPPPPEEAVEDFTSMLVALAESNRERSRAAREGRNGGFAV